jgi:chromosome segregation ATPase
VATLRGSDYELRKYLEGLRNRTSATTKQLLEYHRRESALKVEVSGLQEREANLKKMILSADAVKDKVAALQANAERDAVREKGLKEEVKALKLNAERDKGLKDKVSALQANAERDKALQKEVVALRSLATTLKREAARLGAEVAKEKEKEKEKARAVVSHEAMVPQLSDEALR